MSTVKLFDPAQVRAQSPQTIYRLAWITIIRRPDAVISILVILFFIIVAVFARFIAPYPMMEIHFGYAELPPFWVKSSVAGLAGSTRFLLGTDLLGRDLLTWAIFGTRTSIFLGFLSAPVFALFGSIYGLISGYASVKIDNFLMRVTDIFYAFPPIMVYIIIVLVLHTMPIGRVWNGILVMFIAILSVGWVGIARLVRSKVLSIKNLEYIEAARAIGAKPRRVIFKHIFPNVLSIIIVWLTYMIPQIILIESILGYLGIGISRDDRYAFFATSWGGMFYEGRQLLHLQPMTTILPAVCLILISLAFSFLGDALRDAFDPHTQTGRSLKIQKGA